MAVSILFDRGQGGADTQTRTLENQGGSGIGNAGMGALVQSSAFTRTSWLYSTGRS